MKAIIKTGGKQYYVEENSRIYVEKLDVEAGQKVVFDEVLFVDGKAGKPFVTQGHRQAYTLVEVKKING